MVGCNREAPSSHADVRSERRGETEKKVAPWFETVPASSGLNFRHSTGKTGRFLLPEMETGGVGLLDYDGDGWLDVVCLDGGSLEAGQVGRPRHRLFRNLGAWSFEDVTEKVGLVCPDGYGMGCAVGDYDRDGRPDLYVTQLGSNRLFRNTGRGTFEDVTDPAGVAVRSMSMSAAFVDYDGDGFLDLMVVNYVRWSLGAEMDCYSGEGRRDYCSPLNYTAPAPTVLFHNRGDGTFEDVTQISGVGKAYGNGFGIATGDFDHDGRIDIFVANDAMPNQLWLNQGGGRFREEGTLRGCGLNALGVPRAGMGVVAVDLLQRGWLDLYVTHLVGEGNGLFLNQNGSFLDSLTIDGPMAGSIPFTGFGLEFADFDNDGQLDLYVANGRVRLGIDTPDVADPYAEASSLRRGLGGGRFEIIPRAGLAVDSLLVSRGLVAGDLDNDGAVDLVINNRDGALRVLRNKAGAGGRWIGLQLMDSAGGEARNAVVKIEVGGRVQWRQNQPNQGYNSSQDPRVHFGLGGDRHADQVWVRWPDGRKESFGSREGGKVHLIQAGKGRLVPEAFDW